MKRSKMIELLKNSFNTHMNSDDSIDDDEIFSRVLGDLEDAGMYPPDTYQEGHEVTMWDSELRKDKK